MEPKQKTQHWLLRTISAGDILTLLVSLVALAYGYGNLATKVDNLSTDLAAVKARDITPQAAQRLAVLESQQRVVDREIMEIREEGRRGRAEIINRLERIESKIDNHMERTRP